MYNGISLGSLIRPFVEQSILELVQKQSSGQSSCSQHVFPDGGVDLAPIVKSFKKAKFSTDFH